MLSLSAIKTPERHQAAAHKSQANQQMLDMTSLKIRILPLHTPKTYAIQPSTPLGNMKAQTSLCHSAYA